MEVQKIRVKSTSLSKGSKLLPSLKYVMTNVSTLRLILFQIHVNVTLNITIVMIYLHNIHFVVSGFIFCFA